MSETSQEERQHWRRKRGSFGVFWGWVLILLGVLFFLSSQGWLPLGEWWQYFLIGLGLIFLVDSFARHRGGEDNRKEFSRIVSGFVLVFIGLAFLLGFGKWWPLILVVVGLAMLINAWSRE